MVIQNALHPTILNDRIFSLKSHTRSMVQVAAVDSNVSESNIYALSRIKVHIYSYVNKIPSTPSISRLAYAGAAQRG